MQYRQLGRSGLKVSPICLGTMMFGGPTDEAVSAKIIGKAREAGVNFIDTADAYSKGGSEETVGRAIANNRHAWQGHCFAIIKANGPGNIAVEATADGLDSAATKIRAAASRK